MARATKRRRRQVVHRGEKPPSGTLSLSNILESRFFPDVGERELRRLLAAARIPDATWCPSGTRRNRVLFDEQHVHWIRYEDYPAWAAKRSRRAEPVERRPKRRISFAPDYG